MLNQHCRVGVSAGYGTLHTAGERCGIEQGTHERKVISRSTVGGSVLREDGDGQAPAEEDGQGLDGVGGPLRFAEVAGRYLHGDGIPMSSQYLR